MMKSITTTRDENCTEYQQNTKLGIGTNRKNLKNKISLLQNIFNIDTISTYIH